MAFTRSGDTLTLTRAQFNTVATEHDTGDTVQLCLHYNGSQSLDLVEYDLLVNYSNIPLEFINQAAWATEVDDNLPSNPNRLITDPTKVKDLITDLAEQWPHKLYFNDRLRLIELVAIKPPPLSANTLTGNKNLLELTTRDRPDMQVSTIFVYYGQFDPTRKVDERDNYQITYARVNSDATIRYGSDNTRTIFAPWIGAGNGAAARRIAQLYGRRFGIIPREASFSVDDKDSRYWLGDVIGIQHHDIVDSNGREKNTIFEITSAAEGESYNYRALEFNYDRELPQDDDIEGADIVDLALDQNSITLLDEYEEQYGAASATTEAKFIIFSGTIIGSNNTSTAAINTGTWPSGAIITLEIRGGGYLVGAGGAGSSLQSFAGGSGGIALRLQHPIIINNLGVIGGGGGGGGASNDTNGNIIAGGGGAGQVVGLAGINTIASTPFPFNKPPLNGSLQFGGDGGFIETDTIADAISGGRGGNLGAAGAVAENGVVNSNGGAAGLAIQSNGNAVTYTNRGDIRGVAPL
jgi:hypothetical protein